MIVTPFNSASVALGLTLTAPSTTGFTVACAVAPAASQGNGVYGFRWHAVV